MVFINKRQNEIYEIIKEKSSVNVNDIIPLFNVTPATIRKDLTILEEASLVFRTRGEVHHVENEKKLVPFESRSTINKGAKGAIAKAAVDVIEDGDTIILDSGTTTVEIARLLVSRTNLTVLTNSLEVAHALANSQVLVSLSGGMLLGQNMSTQGPDAEKYFRNIQVNKAFIGASGVHTTKGLTALSSLEANVKQSMMNSAKEVYAVIDSSKFNKPGISLFAEFEDIDYIITESPIEDPKYVDTFNKFGVKCIFTNKTSSFS
ncbi:DeoR/GlpR family DNA-binding transcription regulator [Radiobacillus sp. PE A8.2]|uniref:DeoR/GlpR family DNA-binding transcription regulator n=1 Tax=Radiobacillus sp. PE A8.2 TaxID=3380349 RepID=UPI00388D4134